MVGHPPRQLRSLVKCVQPAACDKSQTRPDLTATVGYKVQDAQPEEEHWTAALDPALAMLPQSQPEHTCTHHVTNTSSFTV
jgi:anti-sigma factor ChrR (cupin superfamily)